LKASKDPVQIEEWWTKWPDDNPAFCPEDNGLCVVDVEHNASPNWTKGRELPETYRVRTPRGGLHYYFAGSLPSTVGKLAPRVNTRGRGGYVLLPPSHVVDPEKIDGSYTMENFAPFAPVPAWIVEALPETSAPITSSPAIALDLEVNVLRAIEHLRRLKPVHMGNGYDNSAYEAACEMKDLGLSQAKAREIMLEHFQCERLPKTAAWIAAKVAHAYRYSQNAPGVHAGGNL
jgi:hypothetical protein